VAGGGALGSALIHRRLTTKSNSCVHGASLCRARIISPLWPGYDVNVHGRPAECQKPLSEHWHLTGASLCLLIQRHPAADNLAPAWSIHRLKSGRRQGPSSPCPANREVPRCNTLDPDLALGCRQPGVGHSRPLKGERRPRRRRNSRIHQCQSNLRATRVRGLTVSLSGHLFHASPLFTTSQCAERHGAQAL
jgi:hypothetical protein